MTPASTPPASVQRLVQHLVGEAPSDPVADPLADELAGWIADSNRFRAFAEAHRDKIRKKLRTAGDAEGRRDVRAELRVAQLLLADDRVAVAFEAHGAGRGGPDFTVMFRGHPAFELEVTRMRRDPVGAADGGPLLAKLRQLATGESNVLLVALVGDRGDAFDVAAAVRGLRARADAKDEAFFARRGFESSRAFYDRFLRLGAVIGWCDAGVGEARATAWTNPSARRPPPERALRALLECLRAG
jgi:hypothetical protein